MRWIFVILSFLPLRVLYAFVQGVVYPLVYYVVRYRRKVVRRNLTASFPEKSKKEIIRLEKQYYHWFCDLFAEIIYSWRISDKEIRERLTIINQDEVEKAVREAGGGFVMLGHYGNWEWIADYARRFECDDIFCHVVYLRLKSKSAEEAMVELRRKRGGEPLEMHRLVRFLMQHRTDGSLHIYDMLADQKPPKHDLDFRVPFLHQMTPFMLGTEKLARRSGYPVFYIDIESPKRGYYTIKGVPISLDPASTEEGYITREFARLLEQNIIRQPHLWLWTHNRFKYSTPIDAL